MSQQLASHTTGLTSVPDESVPPDPTALQDQTLTGLIPVPPAGSGKPTSTSLIQCMASTGRGVAIALPCGHASRLDRPSPHLRVRILNRVGNERSPASVDHLGANPLLGRTPPLLTSQRFSMARPAEPGHARRRLGTGPSTTRDVPLADSASRLLPAERVESAPLPDGDEHQAAADPKGRRALGPGIAH